MATERVYIITKHEEPPPQEVFSNLEKLVDSLKDEYDIPSYDALRQRLYRARKRTGKGILRLKAKDGTFLVIEIKGVQ